MMNRCFLVEAATGQATAPPPNAPARVEYNDASGALTLDYHGTRILSATVTAQTPDGVKAAGAAIKMESSAATGEKVEQRLKFLLAKPQEGVVLVLRGTVAGSVGRSSGLSPDRHSGVAARSDPVSPFRS